MLLALLALSTHRALAGDVLVPEATPAQLSDFSVAYLFYDMVLGQLRDRGMGVQDADTIRPWAGSDADACFDNPDCPRLLWDHDAGGSALIVLGVGQSGDGLEVTARIYRAGDDQPAEIVHDTVPGGGEDKLAARIAGVVSGLAGGSSGSPARIPPSKTVPDSDSDGESRAPVSRTERDDRDGDDSGRDDRGSRDDRESRDDRDPAERRPKAPDAPRNSADEEQAHMGVPAAAYARFRESGLSREEWLRQQRVRTGKVSLEFNAGYGAGDVDRGYGVRVLVEKPADSFQTTAASTAQGPGAGAGFTGNLGVAYTPTWFLETSVQAGLVLGQKHLNVGWECPTDCQSTSDEQEYDAVNSVEGYVEPRVRILPLATGYVKPYALVGVHLRLWDGFEVPDGSSVDYPNIPAGAGVGLAVGAGVSFDVLPEMSLVIEAPYSITLTSGAGTVDDSDVDAEPTALDPAPGFFRVTGGVALRF